MSQTAIILALFPGYADSVRNAKLAKVSEQCHKSDFIPVAVCWYQDIVPPTAVMLRPEINLNECDTLLITRRVWTERVLVLRGDHDYSEDEFRDISTSSRSPVCLARGDHLLALSFLRRSYKAMTDTLQECAHLGLDLDRLYQRNYIGDENFRVVNTRSSAASLATGWNANER